MTSALSWQDSDFGAVAFTGGLPAAFMVAREDGWFAWGLHSAARKASFTPAPRFSRSRWPIASEGRPFHNSASRSRCATETGATKA